MDQTLAVLVTIITAATQLLLAAIGTRAVARAGGFTLGGAAVLARAAGARCAEGLLQGPSALGIAADARGGAASS